MPLPDLFEGGDYATFFKGLKPVNWCFDCASALAEAQDLIGYAPYLARLRPSALQTHHPSDNRVEIARIGDHDRHRFQLVEFGRHRHSVGIAHARYRSATALFPD